MRPVMTTGIVTAAAMLSACGPSSAESEAGAPAAFQFPASLSPFGDGYPAPGDPCRRLGESEAVANLLDDSAMLVGCPAEEQAAALPGEIVATIDGVTIASIPMGDANTGMGEYPPATEDALVPGTEYNATSTIPCAADGSENRVGCDAGVKRNWGEDGTTLVEVAKPDGRTRAIFFQGTEAYGADSAQSDGSAGWDFEARRAGDETTIIYGPESYVIPDALVVGG